MNRGRETIIVAFEEKRLIIISRDGRRNIYYTLEWLIVRIIHIYCIKPPKGVYFPSLLNLGSAHSRTSIIIRNEPHKS